MAYEAELKAAMEAGSAAARVALDYRRKGVTAEVKSDASPVTIADRESERIIVERLLNEFPNDGLLGEEGANAQGTSGRRWIIDPIDGTRDYVRGNRLWSNLIALEVNGVVELGVCQLPAMGETYWSVRGAGAWLRDAEGERRIERSDITEQSQAVLCVNSLQYGTALRHAEKLLEFTGKFWAVRSMGGAMDAMMVCRGQAEFWIEPTAKPWDIAVIQVIAREAGVRFFDYTGADTIYGNCAILCVPALEKVAREFLELR